MTKTVDERVEDLMQQLPYANKTAGGVVGFRRVLRLALLEIARDQRHGCAEAVMGVAGDNNNPWMIDKDAAHAAVMNTRIKAPDDLDDPFPLEHKPLRSLTEASADDEDDS